MRRELFGTDWRLVARMVLAAIGTPLVVAAALVTVVWVAPPTVIAFVALASVVGAVRGARDRRGGGGGWPPAGGRPPTRARPPRPRRPRSTRSSSGCACSRICPSRGS